MVQPADWDCVFIAHLSAESTRLSKPNVMGLGRRAAAHDAWLSPDELTVLPVAQADGFRRNATPPDVSVIRENRRRDCDRIFNLGNKLLLDWRRGSLFRRGLGFFLTGSRSRFDCFEPFPEAGFDKVAIGDNQRVLGR